MNSRYALPLALAALAALLANCAPTAGTHAAAHPQAAPTAHAATAPPPANPDKGLGTPPAIPADLSFLEPRLGWDAIGCVENAARIDAYTLDPLRQGDGGGAFHGFYPAKPAATLSVPQAGFLQAVVLSEEHHGNGETVKNCRFTPNAGFRFYDGETPCADLLVSTACGEWRFTAGFRTYQNDYAKAGEYIARLLGTMAK